MDNSIPITTLILDIGGVLLTNGWGHVSREAAAEIFKINYTDMQNRHQLVVDTYEEGKITLDEYLNMVVFYKKRPFTKTEFREFILAQSTPNIEMIEFIKQLKKKHHLKIGVLNNEGRELNEFRIKKFQLNHFVDFFVSSCFVHLKKPDVDIFHLILDIAQVPAEQIIYIEDTLLFTDVGKKLGMRIIQHENYFSTSIELAAMGMKI
jgi:putative hydrolase of the HAD superfamily